VIQALRIPKSARLSLPLPALAFPLGFVALFALYLFTARFDANNSDNAGIILEARAMLHGNLILRGWDLPPDTFITTEMPLDALLSIFFSGEQLFKVTPALIYAAIVTGAAYLASTLAATPAARWLAAAACAALLAFPVGVLFSVTMNATAHLGTIAACLAAWWAYARWVRRPASRTWLIAFVAATALSVAGDPLAEVLLVAPVVVVCAWLLVRTRGEDRAARCMLGGAIAALLIGAGLRQALILGGARIASATPTVASPDSMLAHLQWLWVALATLFHFDLRNGPVVDQGLILDLLNAMFLIIGVVGFVRLFRRTLLPVRMRDSLTGVLSWAIVGNILAFVLSDFAHDLLGVRYLLPAFVAAGVLCASALAEVISSRNLAPFIAAFLAASVLSGGIALTRRSVAVAPERPLVVFLESHRMTTGLAPYWSADITTLRSGGTLQVIPITSAGGRISLYRWHASDDWFRRERLATATFIVDDGRTPAASFDSAVIATFGMPDHIYTVGQYTIFAWDHPFISPATGLG
jgi:hypothetical protein